MIFFRLLFATVFTFLIFAVIDFKKMIKINKKELGHQAIIGLFMTSAFTLYMAALLYAPVANVALINSIYVLIVPLLAFVFLREKLSYRLAIAVVIALLGAVILNPFASGFLLGNSIAFIQAFIFAGMLVYMRKEEKHQDVGTVFWFFLFATLFSAPLLAVQGIGDVLGNLNNLLMLAFISTTLPYTLLAYGLKKVDASTSSILTLVTFPLASIIFAYLILEEVVALNVYFGGSLLIASGLITLWKCKQKKHFLCH
jgi:drug/metabolite transporter (DMT)-like permease